MSPLRKALEETYNNNNNMLFNQIDRMHVGTNSKIIIIMYSQYINFNFLSRS